MRKSTLNAVVDVLLLVSMASVVFMGILFGFFIGRGAVPQAEKYLWGLHRHDWGDLHLIFSLILTGLVILHFILHVDWARRTSRRFLRLHWVVSLVILFLIAAGILYASIILKRLHPGDWDDDEEGLGKGRGRGLRLEEDRGLGRGFGPRDGRGRGQEP